MTAVYLIHGFIGSGKSTLSRQVAEAAGAVRFSFDEWYLALFAGTDRLGVMPDAERRVSRLIRLMWPEVARAGADVVLDLGLWTRADREDTALAAARVGAEPVLIEVTTTDAVALRRCALRNAVDRSAFVIDEGTYWSLREGFEPCGSDEERVTVRT